MRFQPLNQSSPAALFRLLVGIAMLLALSIVVPAQDDESKGEAPRTGMISGRVVNEIGQPVPYATVYLSALMNPMQARVSNTDGSGNFRVDGLDALVYTLSATAPSYYPTPRDPESPQPYYRIGDSVTISLTKGGVITGVVTSANGEPVVQANVRAILIRDANGKPSSSTRFATDRLTDDRGVYRIYGLSAGTYIVAAGGRGSFGYSLNAYDTDAPTYAPASSRDTAAEIAVRPGEEMTVDIRYRGEPGHVVSGVVSGPVVQNSSTSITLSQVVNGAPVGALSLQAFNSRGFAFYGVADGVYDLTAQNYFAPGENLASEPRRITVKGADLSGIEVVIKELALIRGHIVLEPSQAEACKNKRQPLLSETVVLVRRSETRTPKEQLALPNSFAQAVPDKSGDFALRNLAPGQFDLSTRFFAKYWYLRSIVQPAPASSASGTKATNRQIDLAKNGIALKFGERVSGVTITLAAGAASLRGSVRAEAGESMPDRLYVILVPAEKEGADDLLRFFTALVQADGTFAINNLPPGRYWALLQSAGGDELQFDGRLRTPDAAAARAKLRGPAETAHTEVELKPCQNMVDYQLPLKRPAPKNQASAPAQIGYVLHHTMRETR